MAERQERWAELTELLDAAGRRPERLSAAQIRRLGSSYRSAAADLALARRRFPGDVLVGDLERLVGRARAAVYGSGSSRDSLAELARRGYWRRVAERPALLAIAAALLFVPMMMAALWAWSDPGGAAGLVPAEFQGVTEPRTPGEDLGLAADEQAAAASAIFTNNIRVAIVAFAGGLAFGVGTAAMLVFNGVLIGAIAGLAVSAGNGRPFVELVTAHGVLELSCIVVAGSAGLRLGWALVDPGELTRLAALQRQARPAVELVIGTAAWLVVAGLVEGFVTPAGLGLPAVLAVGVGLGSIYWGLVVVAGRPGGRDEPTDPRRAQSRARALRRR